MMMTESGARPTSAARVLIAGDESILPVITGLIEVLPGNARGQVFVEVPSSAQIVPLETPERITVSWLPRDVRSGEPGTGERCHRGQALGRAVRAWVGEMTTGDVAVDGAELCVWLGGEAASLAELRNEIAGRLGSTRETLVR
jgi:NADPH-dependent ferric siderophore reductase